MQKTIINFYDPNIASYYYFDNMHFLQVFPKCFPSTTLNICVQFYTMLTYLAL